jgi:hypothetical protein
MIHEKEVCHGFFIEGHDHCVHDCKLRFTCYDESVKNGGIIVISKSIMKTKGGLSEMLVRERGG